jgi:sulfite reductase (NADPH) flavoprotein alpha-component
MNKMLDTKKLLAGVSLIPESAPFDEEQRAWLNGFFAGMTGIEEVSGRGSGSGLMTDAGIADEVEEEEDFPWHDDSLGIDERLELADDRPYERKLMAAMAQLDCGSCGYLCQTYSEAIASGEEDNLTLCSPGGKETVRAIKKLVKLNAESGGEAGGTATATAPKAGDGTWSRKNPFAAKLISNEKLTGEGSAKDVRHVEIDLTGSDLDYRVGDSLGVYPSNCPDLMDEIVAACEMSDGDQPDFLVDKDLTTATEELAEWFIENLIDGNEKKKAEALAADEDLLDEMDVLDFLKSFKTLKIPFSDLLQAIPVLNPRLYSIASSLKKHPDQVHLTVGKVTYEKNDRVRKGVASTMLAERVETGSELKVFIQPSHGFTVPADPNAPMIMVGPGTGIAPFVSFLQEREATGAKGDNWLFFGDQKSETDFLYRDMLEGYVSGGQLKRLDTAFSRDQDHKIYVQDRMRENGAEIFKWLEAGGYFFVCGDASRMAKDVDTALHEVIAQHGNMSADQAKAYVKKLATENRYERDVY